MKRLLSIMVGVLLLGNNLQAQDSLYLAGQEEKPQAFRVSGYVKYLSSITFSDVQVPIPFYQFPIQDNFFHNRLNLRYYPGKRWTIAVEGRNRLFFGEQVKLLGDAYVELIDPDIGWVDLGIRWYQGKGVFLHTIIDRAYVNYAAPKWELRIGRQRINWGKNLVWNPNDLFNALNYLDFDYEERPGTDAVRFQYFTGLLSRFEVAFAPGRADTAHIGAAMYKFHLGTYDVQALAGYYRGDLALGAGWEGYIGGAGFKGEATWFVPTAISTDSLQSISASVSADYQAGKVYLLGSVLFNNRGTQDLNIGDLFLVTNSGAGLSPKNLFSGRWAFFTNASMQPHPLLSVSAAVIYSPTANQTILFPTVTYSIKENWDVDLVTQAFLGDLNGNYQHVSSSVFFRLKWSY